MVLVITQGPHESADAFHRRFRREAALARLRHRVEANERRYMYSERRVAGDVSDFVDSPLWEKKKRHIRFAALDRAQRRYLNFGYRMPRHLIRKDSRVKVRMRRMSAAHSRRVPTDDESFNLQR